MRKFDSSLRRAAIPSDPNKSGQESHLDELLDNALEESFPASDPPAVTPPTATLRTAAGHRSNDSEIAHLHAQGSDQPQSSWGHHAFALNAQIYYLFDHDQYEPFELGAKLIALLAFPGPKEIGLRHRAYEALCAQTIHATCAADPANAASWRARFPVYAAIDKPEIRRRLRTVKRRLGDRMKAAQMALGYFDEALRHMFAWIGESYPDLKPDIGDIELRPTPLPDGVARHSINALTQHHFPFNNEEGLHNREQRIWRESLPIIHLAVAFYVLGRHLQPGVDVNYGLNDRDLHQQILARAQVHEQAVDFEWGQRQRAGQNGSSTFVINPGVLIRCRAEKSETVGF